MTRHRRAARPRPTPPARPGTPPPSWQSGLLEPASHRTGAAEHALEHADSVGEERTQQPLERRERRDDAGLADQPGRPRRVADVRREPAVESRPAKRRRRPYRDDHPAGGRGAQDRADRCRRHRSTRCSVGSRAMRSMTRYATSDSAPPTSRTTTPEAVLYARTASGRSDEQAQHQPRRGEGKPSRVDRPALAGLELGAGAGVLAEERRQGTEQPAEVAATDLAGHADRLDDAVADRVGERRLEPVDGLVEPAGRRGSPGRSGRTAGAAPRVRVPRSARWPRAAKARPERQRRGCRRSRARPRAARCPAAADASEAGRAATTRRTRRSTARWSAPG